MCIYIYIYRHTDIYIYIYIYISISMLMFRYCLLFSKALDPESVKEVLMKALKNFDPSDAIEVLCMCLAFV